MKVSTMIDSKIFRDWFGSQEMREIFTDEYRLQRWLDVEAALARVQGRLGKPEITWHAARDRIAEFVSLLASTCATMGKIAKEVINLQKTEVVELAEPFVLGKVGSSTMPQKRNPHLCEVVLAISKMVRYHAALALEGMVQEHERDMAAWMAEWEMVPQACILTSGLLQHSKAILQNLWVNEKKMRSNLDMLQGLILSEPVMFALAEKVGHHAAHRIIYEIAMKAHESGEAFKEALLADERVASHLGPEKIDQLLDPEKYTGLSLELVDRLIGKKFRN